MHVKVISERDNPLLKRKEILIELETTGPTPSRKEIKEMITANYGTKNFVIKKIEQKTGTKTVHVKVFIYEDGYLEMYEPKYMIERTGVEDEGEGVLQDSGGQDSENQA
jgi:small subunit ribosomal protein S24e